ncbi:hypothetical protein BJ322DRAFT_1106877 [Thelephora terrestris]|uniref:DUF6533 domain-containing protein n=1 Tax=Thelephora terrestris TaxID=56493 RepID=A0A9P6HGX0_9AGAM|nr:hypothetical protein BJ322DRAFT_1106877 [Thelephora terrestris]
MSDEVYNIIMIENEQQFTAYRYYALATCAILFYDWLLTLADEVKYVWFGKKSWTFWLFIAIRYCPMAYQFLQFAELAWESHDPELIYTADVGPIRIQPPFVCDAHSVLDMRKRPVPRPLRLGFDSYKPYSRIYAVTKKNVPIASGFALITVAQFGLGVSAAYLAGPYDPTKRPYKPAYNSCSFSRGPSPIETAYASLSIIYDTLAFLAVILQARRLRVWGFSTSTLLDTIAEDSTRYFAVIFTNHLVLVVTLTLGGVSTTIFDISELQPMASTACTYSHSLSFFQSPALTCESPNVQVLCLLSNGRFQVSPPDDFADPALAEESCGLVADQLVAHARHDI